MRRGRRLPESKQGEFELAVGLLDNAQAGLKAVLDRHEQDRDEDWDAVWACADDVVAALGILTKQLGVKEPEASIERAIDEMLKERQSELSGGAGDHGSA